MLKFLVLQKTGKDTAILFISETIRHRQHGIHDTPTEITFESLDDFLKFLNKEKEFSSLKDNYHYIKNELPQLNQWLIENPKEIISNSTIWLDLVKVCQWFIHHFEAKKYYIRELPISVHTKFIENNAKTLRAIGTRKCNSIGNWLCTKILT
ncbi:DUF3322 domain-containing protein [Marivirga tractuosa]|uniref:DUF3322 domain-containing protein n=1 Tax=Marivirga tractuosa TaxID=1006 RepID=UPI0035CF5590